MRIGYGWDSHEFKRGVPLKIGGVVIEHPTGMAGHSDGDVLLHALTDALLGAVAAGDIGTHFPPSDPKWKGADSALFVREARDKVKAAGFRVAVADVGIKAKTPEGMGTDNAAIAHVVVLLTKGTRKGQRRAVTAVAVPQAEVDSVAEGLIESVPETKRVKK